MWAIPRIWSLVAGLISRMHDFDTREIYLGYGVKQSSNRTLFLRIILLFTCQCHSINAAYTQSFIHAAQLQTMTATLNNALKNKRINTSTTQVTYV